MGIEDIDPEKVTVRDRSEIEPIEKAVAARKLADDRVEQEVYRARANGITWTEIASGLGVSHQAAIQKYTRKKEKTDGD